MTRMRLLAPSQLVTTAESLHELEHALAALCFKEPLPATVALDDARLQVRVCRERLLEAARRALRLRDTAPISDKNEASWDEFQYFTQSYGEQTKNSGE